MTLQPDEYADAFGEYIYLRTRNGSLEAPCCGAWLDREHEDNLAYFECRECNCCFNVLEQTLEEGGIVPPTGWGKVWVPELLLDCRELIALFIPGKVWNKGRNWVVYDHLFWKWAKLKGDTTCLER